MKFSMLLPSGFKHEFTRMSDPLAAFARVVQVAKFADDAGYETLLVPDHLTTIPPSHETLFEAWSLITALAGKTSRVRLGLLVTANSYRNPTLTAKIASTVDVISNGRLVFGIGAGWWEPDYVQYGYEFGTAGERLRKLDEALQIILGLWTQDETTFDGQYYRVHRAINEPKGVQKPHIPLMIGGGGEKKTLRLVAQYGDACNILNSPEVAAHKFAVLKQHCSDVGRDYDTINRTVTAVTAIADTDEKARQLIPPAVQSIYPSDVASYGLIGTAQTIERRIVAFEAAGVQELIINFADATDVEQAAQFTELFLPTPRERYPSQDGVGTRA